VATNILIGETVVDFDDGSAILVVINEGAFMQVNGKHFSVQRT